jgi:hypothetical protein
MAQQLSAQGRTPINVSPDHHAINPEYRTGERHLNFLSTHCGMNLLQLNESTALVSLLP